MLQTVSQRFQGSCMMVMRRTGEEVTFLGSAFLVHSRGYMLTTARIVAEDTHLVVVPPDTSEAFPPATRDEVSPVPVEVISRDEPHDVALLRLKPDMEINMPGEVLGSAEEDPRGSLLMSLGIPFGYYRVHGVAAAGSILAGRIQSRTGTRLIIFDRRVQFGDAGGPLISAESSRVIGVVGGVFDPVKLEGNTGTGELELNSDLSFAMSIEYGAALLDQALQASRE